MDEVRLSPYAVSYYPAAFVQRFTSSEDRRSLYMTFSSGARVTSAEIRAHFNRVYGRCVEHVFVQDELSDEPKYGKIIFKKAEMAAYILGVGGGGGGDDVVVKIMVNKKPVWLKQYVARTFRRAMFNRNYRI